MTKQTTTKVKVSATSLIDNKAFKSCSVWVLLHNGKQVGKIIWAITGNGGWKCSIICGDKGLFGFTEEQLDKAGYDAQPLNALVVGSAGGYGYDKRSASFADCLTRNGLEASGIAGVGESAIRGYLNALNIEVIEAI